MLRLDLMPSLEPYETKVDDLMRLCREKWPTQWRSIPKPPVRWAPKPTKRILGEYDRDTGAILLDVFSAVLEPDHMMREVVPHCFAHHVAWTLFRDAGHGGETFMPICRAFGIPETGHAKWALAGGHLNRRVPAECACRAVQAITYTLARNTLTGQKRYVCKKCRGDIVLPKRILREPVFKEGAPVAVHNPEVYFERKHG